jgi:SAM-dependent methyltransferase
VAETYFDQWIARHYAQLWPELFDPAVLDPTVNFLADLVGPGPTLEFGIGTGRVAIPLAARGFEVHGIELSPAMVDELRESAAPNVTTVVGDFATTRVPGAFSLVFLLRNTITNLTTQDEQILAFHNAAAHLRVGGCFVVENYLPALRSLPPGQTRRVFQSTLDHVAIEEYDFVAQIAISRHWWVIEDTLRTFESPHRYVWPAELDLMAELAGMKLRDRWADFEHSAFTEDSASHVSVWEKVA